MLGWVVLLALLVALMWIFGMVVGVYMGELLLGRSFGSVEATLPGIELAIVPLAAIAAARLRWQSSDRTRGILALRASRSSAPLLPLLIAASLVGLAAYLVWTWGRCRPCSGRSLSLACCAGWEYVLAAGFVVGAGCRHLPSNHGDIGRDVSIGPALFERSAVGYDILCLLHAGRRLREIRTNTERGAFLSAFQQ